MGLYVSFSLPRDFLHFLKSFLWKYTQNMSSKDGNAFKNFKYISTKSNRITGYAVYFHENKLPNWQKTPDKTVSKDYFSKLPSARPLFIINLPSLDDLAHFWGHTVIMNCFKYSIILKWSSNIWSEQFFHGWECFRSRTKHKLKINVQRTWNWPTRPRRGLKLLTSIIYLDCGCSWEINIQRVSEKRWHH